jgi:hypothetical protein
MTLDTVPTHKCESVGCQNATGQSLYEPDIILPFCMFHYSNTDLIVEATNYDSDQDGAGGSDDDD